METATDGSANDGIRAQDSGQNEADEGGKQEHQGPRHLGKEGSFHVACEVVKKCVWLP
jgi:hypothetical protein